MAMDSTTIDLPGSEIGSITREDGKLKVHFSRACIIKTMSGSEERTRWWQVGDLVFEEAEVEGDLPECPCVCDGGDVGENVYTYRDMLPIPLESQGRAHCELRFKNQSAKLKVMAIGVKLVMQDRPQYIEHIRD
jgi:hypothetical protein